MRSLPIIIALAALCAACRYDATTYVRELGRARYPAIGETLVVGVDSTLHPEEMPAKGGESPPACELRRDGRLLVVASNGSHYLLRYRREGGYAPGECPQGTTFVESLRDYELLARDELGYRVYDHEVAALPTALRARREFERRYDR